MRKRETGVAAGQVWAALFAMAAVAGWVMYTVESQGTGERQQAMERLRGERQEAASALERSRAERDALRTRLEKTRQAQQALQETLAEVRAQQKRLRGELETRRESGRNRADKLETARSDRERLEAELADRTEARQETRDELARLRQERERLQAKLESARASQGERADLQQRIAEAGERIDTKEAELATAQERLEAARGDLREAEQALTELRGKVERLQKEKARQAEELQRLRTDMQAQLQSRAVRIDELEEGLAVIRLEAGILFDSGAAWVTPGGQKVLDRVAELLRQFPQRRIQVVGHTDALPIGEALEARYPSNWELSTARAAAAVRYLQYAGDIAPERMAAVGYGPYHPVAGNDDPAGRARNRRIEIRLLPPEGRLPSRSMDTQPVEQAGKGPAGEAQP